MFVPLSSPDITQKEINTVLEVLRGRVLSMGPMVKKFEDMISEFVGTRYAIAVNSGTSGLHLAVRALGLGHNDEVITTPFSFISSSNCLLFEKAKPVFVDIDRSSMNIEPELIKNKITPRTKAILPVHVFGHPADMKKILTIAREHNLFVIEDACEALGSNYGGKMAGSESDVSVFAFYPNKQITTGEGGIIVTNSKNVMTLCQSMRNQGRGIKGGWTEHRRLGYNYRLSELNAALGVSQMERIKEILAKRQTIAAIYNSKLEDLAGVQTPYVAPGVEMSWFVYVIRFSPGINRNQILKYMLSQGIECRPYFQPIHLQLFYKKEFGYRKGAFPVTEEIAGSTLALPFFSNLSIEAINYVVEKLHEAILSAS